MKYSRQEKLDFIPNNFNKLINNKKIVIVGCGGVGSVLSEILVRGGFLSLVLIDNDIVDESNLARQIFFEEDIGEYKANSLEKYLIKINKNVKITKILGLLDEKNINNICKDTNLIVDASDNFKIRKIINEFCEKNNKDWIYNGAIRAEVVSCLFRGEDKLFNKIFPKEIIDERCCEVGVLSSTTYLSASLAYNKILKYFLGIEDKTLIKVNLWSNKLFNIKIKYNNSKI